MTPINFHSIENLFKTQKAVSSLSFAANRQHILGSANDYAARIWDLSTGKVLKTLTGHTGAVSAARYLSATSVVTGSSDRTLRIWDLTKIACIKTLWPSSKCTDVASLAIDGSLIASAHFNKQVHFYDYRIESITFTKCEPLRIYG